jgi:hypothetical protein
MRSNDMAPDVVEIVESQAELRANERIGGRIQFPGYAVGLQQNQTHDGHSVHLRDIE